MGPGFLYPSVLDIYYPVGVYDRAQPVGRHHDGPALTEFPEVLHDETLVVGIQ